MIEPIVIKVVDKVPIVVSGPQYVVCDNSDYTVVWQLDEEWAQFEHRTMQVNYKDGTYERVLFSGDSCTLPAVPVSGPVHVGLFAGDIHTTRPARLLAVRSATTDCGEERDPMPNGYAQAIEALDGKLDKNQGADNAGKALVIGDDGNVGPGKVRGGSSLPAMSSDTAGKMLTNDGEKAEWGGAVRYDVAQDIDYGDKEQARLNIGAFPGRMLRYFFDTTTGSAHDNDIVVANRGDIVSPGNIYTDGDITNKGMVFPAYVLSVYYPPQSSSVYYVSLLDTNGVSWQVWINWDYNSNVFVIGEIVKCTPPNVMRVNLTRDDSGNWTADKNWDDAAALIEAGGYVYGYVNGITYALINYQRKTDGITGMISLGSMNLGKQFSPPDETAEDYILGCGTFGWLSDGAIDIYHDQVSLYDLPYPSFLKDQSVNADQQAQARFNIGLDQVDNTSDANKPVSTAQGAAIKAVQDALDQYKTDVANGTVIPARATGDASGNNIANTYATKQELANLSAVQIRNKDEVINATQETVQTVATAYMVNNYGRQPQNLDGLILTITDLSNDKILYIYSAVSSLWINAGINGVDLSKYVGVVQQAFTDAEKAQARQNIGAGTSSFSGSYNDLTDKPTIPSKTSDLTNDSGFITSAPVTSVNNKTGAVTLAKGDVGLGNVDNVKQYSASNPPPYPVTSVNGKTGAVQLDIPGTCTLPVASPTQLGGVKPVAKTDAMTKGVGVDANGGLYAEPDSVYYVDLEGTFPNFTTSKTNDEIYSAYQSGKTLFCRFLEGSSTTTLPLLCPGEDLNVFANVMSTGAPIDPDSAQAYTVMVVDGMGLAVKIDLAVKADIPSVPTALPNPNALTIKIGDTTVTYDGSSAQTVEITDAGELVTETTEVLPAYINQIPLSTDTSGAVLDGVGYESGQLDMSGAVTTGTSFVSGFIPVKKGDVIRVKDPSSANFSTGLVFALYKADRATGTNIGRYINTMQASTAYGAASISGNVLTWDTSSVSYYFWTDFAYLRVTTNSAASIVTVNEEIAETSQTVMTLKPTVKVGQENLKFSVSAPPLAGRKVVVFGDSLIGMTRDQTSVPAYAAAYTGAEVYNVGFGGCRMSVHPTSGYAAFSMWALADAVAAGTYTTQDAQASSGSDYFPEQLALLKSIDFGDVDMVVIHYGTNDFAANVVIDNASDDDDTTTLCGALRYSLRKLQSAYPKIRIFVSAPIYRKWGDVGAESYENSNGKKLWDFCTALAGVAAEFNCAVIDGYRALGINAANDAAFSSDGTHLNDHGRQAFGECIGGNLITPIPAQLIPDGTEVSY